MPDTFLSYDDIINLAACHTCCAMQKEPCRFNRTEDPEGVRAYRRQSHDKRVILARKILSDLTSSHLTVPAQSAKVKSLKSGLTPNVHPAKPRSTRRMK